MTDAIKQTSTSIPRRANRIRQVAADMASRKLREVNARQAVSDRIGYAVAVTIGAIALHFGGVYVVEAIVVLYIIGAKVAFSRYKKARAGL